MRLGSARILLDLLAQIGHVHVDGPRIPDERIPGDPFEELLAGEDPAGVLHEDSEEIEFRRREFHLALGDGHLPGSDIQGDVAARETVVGFTRGQPGPMEDGSHTGDEHLRAERLGEIVVHAGLEPREHVLLFASRGEDEDGSVALRLDLLRDLQPGESRQHDVEDEEIGQLPLRFHQTVPAVGRLYDLVAFALEVRGNQSAHVVVVFDDQDPGRTGAMLHVLSSDSMSTV